MASKKKVVGRKVVKAKKAVKLTKAEMRVAVCKDVLARIKAKKVNIAHGVYVELPRGTWGDVFNKAKLKDGESCDLQKLLPKVGKCNVCAKGALFLSAVDKYDQCEVRNVQNPHSCWGDGMGEVNGVALETSDRLYEPQMSPTLTRLFSQEQLDLIEDAFECAHVRVNAGAPFCREAAEWGRQFDRGEPRMVAIMKNVIAHKGTFVLPKVK